jgi:hypothetical protein
MNNKLKQRSNKNKVKKQILIGPRALSRYSRAENGNWNKVGVNTGHLLKEKRIGKHLGWVA